MTRHIIKNRHQKKVCYYGIGLSAQNVDIALQLLRRTYVMVPQERHYNDNVALSLVWSQ
jgi:hypothetical protein